MSLQLTLKGRGLGLVHGWWCDKRVLVLLHGSQEGIGAFRLLWKARNSGGSEGVAGCRLGALGALVFPPSKRTLPQHQRSQRAAVPFGPAGFSPRCCVAVDWYLHLSTLSSVSHVTGSGPLRCSCGPVLPQQEPKTDQDEEHCRKVNEYLNNPPMPGALGASGSGGHELSALGGNGHLPERVGMSVDVNDVYS